MPWWPKAMPWQYHGRQIMEIPEYYAATSAQPKNARHASETIENLSLNELPPQDAA